MKKKMKCKEQDTLVLTSEHGSARKTVNLEVHGSTRSVFRDSLACRVQIYIIEM